MEIADVKELRKKLTHGLAGLQCPSVWLDLQSAALLPSACEFIRGAAKCGGGYQHGDEIPPMHRRGFWLSSLAVVHCGLQNALVGQMSFGFAQLRLALLSNRLRISLWHSPPPSNVQSIDIHRRCALRCCRQRCMSVRPSPPGIVSNG